MRGSLDKRDAPTAKELDEELRWSATEVSMARSRITEGELEDIRLIYDIPASVSHRAPSPEELADDPPDGFVAIYEPAMQQGLLLPMHQFFHEVLRDWNLALFQITPNGWGQMVASYLLPNKIHNWKEKFFFVGGDWEFMLEDPLPHVSIPLRFGELDYGKPPIPKKDQGELRSKWDKV
ncbi:Uncharacterized protein Adt_32793 [Abeliophyllum distichum]|uniref:Transposase (putative) gypsy type domain-containing protein n=1 Tax=Abeliophyllum distichum TaxID=126358 RepID=A0ABD1QVN9_9LAMI